MNGVSKLKYKNYGLSSRFDKGESLPIELKSKLTVYYSNFSKSILINFYSPFEIVYKNKNYSNTSISVIWVF